MDSKYLSQIANCEQRQRYKKNENRLGGKSKFWENHNV